MAVKKQQSKLLAKLGNVLRKAHEQHKGDETEYNKFGDLPAGIQNGIAQLVECKIDTYKKGDMEGELFFYAAGVVVEPKIHERIPVEGLHTTFMEPLCDTPKKKRATVADHYAHILNELRKLGVDTNAIEVDDIETTLEALKEAQPYFRFRTWKGNATPQYPDPRTNHNWDGAVEYEPTEDSETEDNSEPVDVATEEDEEEDTPPVKAASKKAAPVKAAPTAPTKPPVSSPGKTPAKVPGKKGKAAPPPPVEFDDMGDIDSLVERASNDDEEAKARLEELAVAQGYTEEDVESAESWEAVRAMTEAPKPAEIEEEEEEEEEATEPLPEVGEVYNYKPEGSKRAVSCEVTAVSTKNGTVTLKNLVNPKLTYKAIPFDELQA